MTAPEWHAEVLNITPSQLRQVVTHHPDEGRYGDCFRTCIACLIGADAPEDVPHFVANNIARDGDGDADPKGWADLAEARRWLRSTHDLDLFPLTRDDADELGVHYKATVKSPLGVMHSVIGRSGKVVWCPAGHDPAGMSMLLGESAWVISRPWNPDPDAMVEGWREAEVPT